MLTHIMRATLGLIGKKTPVLTKGALNNDDISKRLRNRPMILENVDKK